MSTFRKLGTKNMKGENKEKKNDNTSVKFEDIQNVAEEISSYPAAPIGCIFNDVHDTSFLPGSGALFLVAALLVLLGGR